MAPTANEGEDQADFKNSLASLLARGQTQKRPTVAPPVPVALERPVKIKIEIFEDGTEIPVFTDDANSQKPTLGVDRAVGKKFDVSNLDF